MRFGLILLVLVFALLGAVFGALNSQPVDLDFYFATLSLAKGGVLIAALLIGWLLGGLLVFLTLVLPLRRRLRRAERELRRRDIMASDRAGSAPDAGVTEPPR
jgi:lipopolysaccharide assembly protein A